MAQVQGFWVAMLSVCPPVNVRTTAVDVLLSFDFHDGLIYHVTVI